MTAVTSGWDAGFPGGVLTATIDAWSFSVILKEIQTMCKPWALSLLFLLDKLTLAGTFSTNAPLFLQMCLQKCWRAFLRAGEEG